MPVELQWNELIEATRRIRASRAGAPAASSTVLVLTTFNDEEYVLGAVRAGASGFLLKDAGPDTLVKAVRTVFDGHSLIDPAVTQVLIARCLELETLTQPPSSANGQQVAQRKRRMATLTEREQEILLGLARGASNRELARRLTVSETTIKSHVSNVLTKLDLQSRVQAVVFAYETGLVVPGTTGR